MTHANNDTLPPTFNRLAWSNLAAQSAEQIALAAAPIIAVLLLGAGEGQTGLLQTALTLPFVLFAIPAGLLADRISRRRLMAAAEALRARGLGCHSCADLVRPADAASARFARLCRGMRNGCLQRGGALAGAIAGAVISAAGRECAHRACPHGGVRKRSRARRRSGRMGRRGAGLRLRRRIIGHCGGAARGNLRARACARFAPPCDAGDQRGCGVRLPSPVAAAGLRHPVHLQTAWFVILAVFVPYAVRHLSLSAQGVGTTLAMFGIGMVVGALLATRIMRTLPFGVVIALGPVVGFAAAVVMAATTLVPTPLLAASSFFLLGVGPIVWTISTTTLRQSVTPARLLGRVSAINIMSYGARPLGAGIGALVGSAYGAEACLYLAVAGFGAQALVILLSPAVGLAQQPAMVEEAVGACAR